MIDYKLLSQIAYAEFADVVTTTKFDGAKLRIVLHDNSYVDFWWSLRLPGRFAPFCFFRTNFTSKNQGNHANLLWIVKEIGYT